VEAPPPVKPGVAAPAGFLATQPAVPPEVRQTYLPCLVDDREAARLAAKDAGIQVSVKNVQLLYDVGLLGAAAVRFVDQKRSIDAQIEMLLLAQGGRQMTGLDWGRAEKLPISPNDLTPAPEAIGDNQGPFFAELPEGLGNAKSIAGAAKELADWLYYNSQFDLTIHPDLGVFQRPGEDERAFTIRLQQAARERRDAEVDKLREKARKEIQRVADKIAKEQQELAADQAKAQAKQTEQWVNIGESVVNFFTGRSTRLAVSSATSKISQAQQAAMNVQESEETIARLTEEKQKLEAQLQEDIDAITARWEQTTTALTTEQLKPRRTDVDVRATALAWAPVWQVRYDDGRGERTTSIPAYMKAGA
jgi:hypothetical protein